MPETPAPTLDECVQVVLEAYRDELVELVHRAVDRELEALVAFELAQRTNGASANGQPATADARPQDPPSLRPCRVCGRDRPPELFEKHRNTCRECRQRQARDREHRRAGRHRFAGVLLVPGSLEAPAKRLEMRRAPA